MKGPFPSEYLECDICHKKTKTIHCIDNTHKPGYCVECLEKEAGFDPTKPHFVSGVQVGTIKRIRDE